MCSAGLMSATTGEDLIATHETTSQGRARYEIAHLIVRDRRMGFPECWTGTTQPADAHE
jgi:hypothetical protein